MRYDYSKTVGRQLFPLSIYVYWVFYLFRKYNVKLLTGLLLFKAKVVQKQKLENNYFYFTFIFIN